MEVQEYDYNIRGWLLGVNRKYASEKTSTDSLATATITTLGGEMFTEASDATVIYPTTPYFGFDLGYDKKNNQLIGGIQYSTAQYTGNITGMVWKTSYDRKIWKYDFTYDNTSRLTGQYNTGSGSGCPKIFREGRSRKEFSYHERGCAAASNQIMAPYQGQCTC